MTEMEMSPEARQAAREVEWVAAGAQRLLDHCESQHHESPLESPAGRKLMRMCVDRFTAHLDALVTTKTQAVEGRGVMSEGVGAIVSMLTASHVAAVTLHRAMVTANVPTGSAREVKPNTVVTRSMEIGMALEHDIQFRAWAKGNRTEAEKATLERMKRQMVADRKTWRRRAYRMREIAENPWTLEYQVEVGADLLAALCEACPDVFYVENKQVGGKTQKLFKMHTEAAEVLVTAHDAAALAHPKIGSMIVRPRGWVYR
jgi:hypothetical protein